jgi:cobalt-zinc-cadmium efflux system outer membrane protein
MARTSGRFGVGVAVLLVAALLAASSAAWPEQPVAMPDNQAATSSAAAEAAGLPPLNLDRLIEIALEENPQLAALRNQITAERTKVPQARSLPDPRLGFMVGDALHADNGVSFEARQMIPWPGKLRLMSEAAAFRADRTVTDYTEQAYEIVAQVRKAYDDLYFIDRSIEIALANKSLLADFVQIAEAKYAVGIGIQQDVLRAQVAQSRILDDLLMLRQQRISAQARLNALLNRPPEAPLGPAVILARSKIALPETSLDEMAMERRAMLKGMRLMVDESQTMHALAVRDLKPNYEIVAGVSPGGGGMSSPGTTVSLGVMFELPLYHRTKQDKAVEQRAAEVKATQSDYEAQKTAVFARIGELLAVLNRADREAELLHTGIIPQAELSLESARAGYQVNKVDFLRDYYRAVADYENAVADLERTVGTPLGASGGAGGGGTQ